MTATVRIERFDEPKLSLSYKLTQTMAASGTQVQVTYLLKNDTKFDMTGLSLYDSGVSSSYIPLPQEQLLAGTSMEVPYTFTMGEVDAVINPVVEYTVKGEKQLASCESSATITYVKVELTLSVQQYPATESGTLFALTVTNTGTHAMTDICLYDEIGTELEEPFDLSAGQSRSITYTVAAAVAASTPRRVSFRIQAKDFQGQPYTAESKDSYEIKPYVEADQVNLQLIVTLSNSKFNDDGSLTATILFEMRNYSAVPITKGVLTENNAFNGVVIQYDQLNTGVTTFPRNSILQKGTVFFPLCSRQRIRRGLPMLQMPCGWILPDCCNGGRKEEAAQIKEPPLIPPALSMIRRSLPVSFAGVCWCFFAYRCVAGSFRYFVCI